MKNRTISIVLSLLLATLISSCTSESDHSGHDHGNESSDHTGHDHGQESSENNGGDTHQEEVHLSTAQYNAMKMEIGSLQKRKMSSYVETNGELEVPPQNEAAVTTVIGANITSIKVIEGDKVKKGQVLATISHPDLIKLQTDYISSFHQLDYLEADYNRQSTLLEENVGSGKDFQKIKAEYLSNKGLVKGLEAQLSQIGINPIKLQNGDVFSSVSVISPIDGSVLAVNIKTGQFVKPETELFNIVNTDHIHADFMVFEKDINKIKEGQEIRFKVESGTGKEMTARIYSVGQAFEKMPKAVHIHAEIEQKEGTLLPGMYVRGKIFTNDSETLSLPDDAVVRDGDEYYIFSVENADGEEWHFTPISVKIGIATDGWKEILLMSTISPKQQFALNNAYYLYSEMKKGEAEHVH